MNLNGGCLLCNDRVKSTPVVHDGFDAENQLGLTDEILEFLLWLLKHLALFVYCTQTVQFDEPQQPLFIRLSDCILQF